MNTSRAIAQFVSAFALAGATYAACVTTPSHSLTASQRVGAGLAVLAGALVLPSALIIGSGRDAQF